jgi:hypothetical protein
LLSIATRKAGAEISCPKCGEGLLVPPPPEPASRPKRARAETFENARTEVDIAPPPPVPRPEPVGVGAGVGAVTPQPDRRAATAVRDYLDGDDPPPAPTLKFGEPQLKVKPKPTKPADEPLFERSDFERLLEPVVKKTTETADSKAEGTKPQQPVPARGADAAEFLKLGLPVAEDGVYISRGTAVALTVAFVFTLGIAFAAGFWIGS